MYLLSGENRSNGQRQVGVQIRNSQPAAQNKSNYQGLIDRANSVSLITVLKYYGYRPDTYTRKIICPFQKHQSGRESTPSLFLYPDKNSFWCFGCSTGRMPVDFVANKEGMTRFQAALKIIERYGSSLSEEMEGYQEPVDYSERLEILMELSTFVREFIFSHQEEPNALSRIETLTFALDRVNSEHTLDNDALTLFIIELKTRI